MSGKSYSYPTETVDCPSCEGTGEIFWDVPDVYGRCETCGGSGAAEVCANCLDWYEECSVCSPPSEPSA